MCNKFATQSFGDCELQLFTTSNIIPKTSLYLANTYKLFALAVTTGRSKTSKKAQAAFKGLSNLSMTQIAPSPPSTNATDDSKARILAQKPQGPRSENKHWISHDIGASLITLQKNTYGLHANKAHSRSHELLLKYRTEWDLELKKQYCRVHQEKAQFHFWNPLKPAKRVEYLAILREREERAEEEKATLAEKDLAEALEDIAYGGSCVKDLLPDRTVQPCVPKSAHPSGDGDGGEMEVDARMVVTIVCYGGMLKRGGCTWVDKGLSESMSTRSAIRDYGIENGYGVSH
ncbi:MAG: hypothetical protein MMC33_003898 [Icmadophila ericetorum]|nr:hypothetical protein [Icmadophila ericetorum]